MGSLTICFNGKNYIFPFKLNKIVGHLAKFRIKAKKLQSIFVA